MGTEVKYAILFGLTGLAMFFSAALLPPWSWAMLYPAASFFAVAWCYLQHGRGDFGKQSHGGWTWRALLVYGPYFACTWLAWHALRFVVREACWHRVSEGIYVGRRPLGHELPTDARYVIDLTAEFYAAPWIRRDRRYLALPALDAYTPDAAAFAAALADAAASAEPIYIHCAQGRGRSAMFAAALFVAKGLASSIDDAEAMLRAVRPSVRLRPEQRRLAMEVVADWMRNRALGQPTD